MKQTYMKPAMRVVEIQQRCHLLVGSSLKKVSGGGLRYGGAGTGPARARANDGLDEDDSDFEF